MAGLNQNGQGILGECSHAVQAARLMPGESNAGAAGGSGQQWPAKREVHAYSPSCEVHRQETVAGVRGG